MARFAGRRVQVGIGLETTRGTAVTPVYWYPFLDASMADKDNPIYNESSFGHIMKNSAKTTTLINGEGNLTGKLYAKGLYYFLALVFGQLATTTAVSGDTSASSHVFSLANTNEHLSATIATKTPNEDLRFAMAMIDSLTLTWSPDAYPQIEVAFISKSGVTATNTVAMIAESEFLPKHASMKIASTLAGLTGATALTDIKSFSLTFTKTLSPQQTIDSGTTYGQIFNTDFEVTGSIEKLLNDVVYKGYALQDTVQAMQFSLSDSVNKAGTTTPTSLSFDMSKVVFDSHVPQYGKSDIATETLNFTAILDQPNFAQTIKATLVNKYTYP